MKFSLGYFKNKILCWSITFEVELLQRCRRLTMWKKVTLQTVIENSL